MHTPTGIGARLDGKLCLRNKVRPHGANAVQSTMALISEQMHRIATHRSLAKLLEWGKEFTEQEVAAGRRVLWAPCHALGRSLSLRSWVIQKAAEMLGNSAPTDAPTLLSGAADTLIIADPTVADRESLNWLGELLACAEEVKDLTATPPMPRLVVLLPIKANMSDAVSDFANRLHELGSEDEKVGGKDADPTAVEIDGMLRGLPLRNQEFLASVALAPFPLTREEYDALAKASKAGEEECAALLQSPLFTIIAGEIVPSSGEVRERMRAPLAPEALSRAARLLLQVCASRLELMPDAAIELHARAGEQKQAAKLAKRRVADHETAGRYSEALRIMRQGRDQGFTIEGGAMELDEARTAQLAAQVGDFLTARELVKPLFRRRNMFENAEFIEALAMAMRTLAMRDRFEPRMADSLMRRAIRMNKQDIDHRVRLLVMRVSLLRSQAFTLDERADWLLTHVNQVTLAKCTPATIALYLEETGRQLLGEGNFKRAFKRLRRMISLAVSDQQLAGALIMMSQCRAHFRDNEGALRFASGALQYALRCANLSLVKEAAKLLRERAAQAEAPKPRRKEKIKGRVPIEELPARVAPQPEQMFEILARRFGIARWTRRRGNKVETFGKETGAAPESTVVYEERNGQVRCVTQPGTDAATRAVVLLRADGDDLVQLGANAPADATDESIVRFLLGDKDASPVQDLGVAPPRKSVVDEYMRRAQAQPSKRGLHHAVETMFNKDLLMYLEDQGMNKEDMAAHLGVSRATLYRMYARAGLN